jgi:hypothetical protein
MRYEESGPLCHLESYERSSEACICDSLDFSSFDSSK